MTHTTPLFLMSHPRHDWGIRGGANFLSKHTNPSSNTLAAGAMHDWLDIAENILEAGGDVLVLPPPPHISMTGLPYTAEAGFAVRDTSGSIQFILPNMTPPHRTPEATWIGGFLSALGWKTRACPHLWEAQGDALRLDSNSIIHTYGTGPHARTSKEAYTTIAPLLSNDHILLHFHADPWFHGNTFLAVFQPSPLKPTHKPTLMVCPDALFPGELQRLQDWTADRAHIVTISPQDSRAYATNSLQVASTVLAPHGLPQHIHALWTDLGLSIRELPLDTLFRRGGGAAVCLTNRLDNISPNDVPQHLLYSTQRSSLRS